MTAKRLLDLTLVIVSMVVWLPLMAIVALSVWLRIGRPVMFRQKRLGLDGKLFTLIKFRTMREAVDETGAVLPDVDRLTGFGRWLRTTSLDELPSLVNVLVGEMSLVGPRPLLVEYRDLYSLRQMRRHEVRPGLTGWAQVNGRNSLNWPDKLEMDVWYVENRGLRLDMRILILTVASVLSRRGISAPGEATMTRFTGSGERVEDGR